MSQHPTTSMSYAEILGLDLPAGIDPQTVSEHNVAELQEQLAKLDQIEVQLTGVSAWATRRGADAEAQLVLAEVKFEEIERHVAAEKAEAKRLKLEAARDEKIATKKLRQVNSSKIAILGLLRSMGASR